MYSRIIVLRFPRESADKPVIVNLVRDFDLTFNILKAQISPRREGLMVLELTGSRKNYERGIQYLRDVGLSVEPMAQEIRRDDDRCYQCGACTAVCPTGALHVKRPAMDVLFDSERCSGCEACVRACPARAMIISLDRHAEI